MEKVKAEKKLSYEELSNVANQLSNQNRQLRDQINAANMVNVFKRLDYLFQVVSQKDNFNKSFVEKCIAEIELTMTIPENDDQDSK